MPFLSIIISKDHYQCYAAFLVLIDINIQDIFFPDCSLMGKNVVFLKIRTLLPETRVTGHQALLSRQASPSTRVLQPSCPLPPRCPVPWTAARPRPDTGHRITLNSRSPAPPAIAQHSPSRCPRFAHRARSPGRVKPGGSCPGDLLSGHGSAGAGQTPRPEPTAERRGPAPSAPPLPQPPAQARGPAADRRR